MFPKSTSEFLILVKERVAGQTSSAMELTFALDEFGVEIGADMVEARQ